MKKDMKQALLEFLNTVMHKVCECELKHSCTNPVFGEGNPNASLMFIGEAPGKQEDEEGRPFVGRAGKLLTELIESIYYKRENVYITNIVKYRPPGNRDPKTEEIKACWEWLLAQMELIDPELIVLLGRHSLNAFFPDLKISNARGQTLYKAMRCVGKVRSLWFYPIYHPAAALYDPGKKEILMKDFQGIIQALHKIRNPQ